MLGSPGTLPTCPAVQRGVCSLQAAPSPSPGGALGTLWTCPAQRHLALRRHLWDGAGKALSACGAALPGPGTGSRTGRPGGHAVSVTLSGRCAGAAQVADGQVARPAVEATSWFPDGAAAASPGALRTAGFAQLRMGMCCLSTVSRSHSSEPGVSRFWPDRDSRGLSEGSGSGNRAAG